MASPRIGKMLSEACLSVFSIYEECKCIVWRAAKVGCVRKREEQRAFWDKT
jgi:hypothetical protein